MTHSPPPNIFQRIVRAWEQVHPYNAAQAMKLRCNISPSDAQRAWCQAAEASGLEFAFCPQAQRCGDMPQEGGKPWARVLPADVSLEKHLSDELNRPFDNSGESPFRPFVAQGHDGFYIGLVYCHWVADSVAIRLLLHDWFARLFDPARIRDRPLKISRDGYWKLFGPGRGAWKTRETAWALFRRHMRYRQARKPKTFGHRDYPVRVLLRDLPDGLIDRLVRAARARHIKVHDLFLAAAVEVCEQYVPTQRRKNRPNLAIGSIVDLRPYAPRDLAETFGLFLGFTEVICRVGDIRDFDRLASAIAAQNLRHRHIGIGAASLGWMGVAAAVSRLVPTEKVYHFYRKETPLLAGISNVNLNGAWPAAHHPAIIEQYLRVSPTGPMVPVAFNLTTLGQRLHLAITYRAVLFDEPRAQQMAQALLDRLISITSGF